MSHLNKKALGAGVAMVALSSFVPNPFLTNEAMAQATAADTMNITAEIINPLAVTEITKLDMGSFAVAANGNISIDGSAVTAIVGGVMLTPPVNGVVALKAPEAAAFTLSIPDLATGPIKLATGGGTAPSETLLVTKIFIAADTNMAPNAKTFKTGANNVQTGYKVVTGTTGRANIGANVTFTADNVPGVYTGTYQLVSTF